MVNTSADNIACVRSLGNVTFVRHTVMLLVMARSTIPPFPRLLPAAGAPHVLPLTAAAAAASGAAVAPVEASLELLGHDDVTNLGQRVAGERVVAVCRLLVAPLQAASMVCQRRQHHQARAFQAAACCCICCCSCCLAALHAAAADAGSRERSAAATAALAIGLAAAAAVVLLGSLGSSLALL